MPLKENKPPSLHNMVHLLNMNVQKNNPFMK